MTSTRRSADRGFARLSSLTGALVLAGFTVRLARNLLFLERARRHADVPEPPPRVSVLVPARDEAHNIAACIETLARQSYSHYEIIVLDDQSTDATPALLDDLARRVTPLTVLTGAEPPPAGWSGKCYACHHLAQKASGEWLLFTDADTRHAPASIAMGIAQATALDVALLSAFPAQETGSWSERLVVSFVLDFLPLITIDLWALWRGGSGRASANGQYLLVRADAYRALGGHEAVRGALLDDFALAGRARGAGYRVALVDGTRMLRCRMYRNGGEVWQGFTRSLLPALEADGAERPWWSVFLFAWAYASVFFTPFFRLLFARERAPALLLGWLVALRFVVARRLTRPWLEVATTPFAGLSVMALGLGALWRRLRGGAVRWKGRDYAG